MKIYVVRHGETDYNIMNKISGISDARLTEKGIGQALEAKEKIKGIRFDHIYVSPLVRAIDTAHLITEQKITIDERLHEMDFGIFEGLDCMTPEFRKIKYHLGVRYPGGETFLEVIHRVYSLLDEITSSDDENVLLVCHGAVIRAINSYFYDMSNDDFFTHTTKNCEILIYFKK